MSNNEGKRRRWYGRVGRFFLRAMLVLVVVVSMLYSPVVQDTLLPFVLKQISSPDGMEITVERFRLKFPLTVEARGVRILEKGDPMLLAGEADINVKFFPLLSGRVETGDIAVKELFFRSGTPDSITYMRLNLSDAVLQKPVINLRTSNVDLSRIRLQKGRVDIAMRTDTMPPTPPSPPGAWKISVGEVELLDMAIRLSMEQSIDSLDTHFARLTIFDARVDMPTQRVDIGSVSLDGLHAAMFTPANPEPAPAAPTTDEYESMPWTIRAKHLAINDAEGLYAKSGSAPKPGLDFDYLQVKHLNIDIDSLYNRQTDLRVPLTRLEMNERSGLWLKASGLFLMNDSAIEARDFDLRTTASAIHLDAVYGLDSIAARTPIDVKMIANISPTEIAMLFPDMTESTDMLPQNRNIDLDADITGTMARIDIDNVKASMRNYFTINLNGFIDGVDDFDNASGRIDIDGDLKDVNFMRPMITNDPGRYPPLILKGDVVMNKGDIRGNLKAHTHEGRMALDADWAGRTEAYDVDMQAVQFPVGAFLPGLGVGNVTADIKAKGRGLDPFSPSTDLTADINLAEIVYNSSRLADIHLGARLTDGHADIDLASANEAADLNIFASGNLGGASYRWDVDADIRNLDMQRLGLSDTLMSIKGNLSASVDYAPDDTEIDGYMRINSFDVLTADSRYQGSDLVANFLTSDEQTRLAIDNRDLRLRFNAPAGLDALSTEFSAALDSLTRGIDARDIDIMPFQRTLPKFSMQILAGRNNIFHEALEDEGLDFDNFDLVVANDSAFHLNAVIDSLKTGDTRLDVTKVELAQRRGVLVYRASIDNTPGTLDDFAHVLLNGYVAKDKLSLFINQRNINDEIGYKLGAVVNATDSAFTLRLSPLNPTIGYRKWTVSPDNYITFNTITERLAADLCLESEDSHLDIYTVETPQLLAADMQEAVVDIKNFHIAEWLSFMPGLPPLAGDLTAHIDATFGKSKVNGKGDIFIDDCVYGKTPLGDLNLDLDLATDAEGSIRAITGLKVDGQQVMTASGVLNDSIADNPLNLDLRLTRFPLAMANPVLDTPDFKLGGWLTGEMKVSNRLSSPRLNGYMAFDSATVNMAMLGTDFRLTQSRFNVDDNMVKFDDFEIYGINDSPLRIDGTINMQHIENPMVNLTLKSDNIQIVGRNKKRNTDIYGKAFLGIDAKVRGNMRFMMANANVVLREGSNVTYVLTDSNSPLTPEAADLSDNSMVKFVNFNDTVQVEKADSIEPARGMVMSLNASVTVAEGTTIGVDLAPTGTDRVQLQGNGTLEYTLSPMGDTRFIGRLNIPQGYIRYTPPLISEKQFTFRDGSYVTFNGDIGNPAVNISAVDRIRTNITQEGANSRLIYFNVILNATGTVSDLDINFDLSTDDDVTVENELQSMSPEQRANQAMNMLLYGVYTGPGTSGASALTSNPLYSFLESQVNNWMANNVRGIDISFGIDEYERTVGGNTTNAMSYSYQVSKSLFDDRFKIVVGGNYSTDANADENFSQNLINDISFEYMINRNGTMYVRLFRHTGFESILEGEVTQTGVGFVYRRKVRRLIDIFRPFKRTTVPTLPNTGQPGMQSDSTPTK